MTKDFFYNGLEGLQMEKLFFSIARRKSIELNGNGL